MLTFGKDRLAQTGERLCDGTRARKRSKHQWFELQDTCAYHEKFSEERLFWQTLTGMGQFSYFSEGENTFCLSSAYMLTGKYIKFLCGILNSRLVAWFMRETAVNWGDKVKWLKTSVDLIPVPIPNENTNDSIIKLVDQIINAKTENHDIQTSELERKIDTIVFSLYGLSSSEIEKIINLTNGYD